MTLGQINGGTVQFLVDTGATAIAIPSADARRLGINYLNGQRGYTETANGRATAYRITLDTVTVGGITLHSVEAVVLEGNGLNVALLGMTFLSRTEMKRDGQSMTLVKRF
jgi:aspartyl protease family protein